METFIEIIKQIGLGIVTIFLACPIFFLFLIEYIEHWEEKKKKSSTTKSSKTTKKTRQEIEEESKRLDEEIARIDSFTRSIKGATNHDYIKEQQKIHFPDKFK